eukprot:CAMPEP_0195137644 /NCGR_PEP_ID=MMETSP0448-20130528/156337_1 /TAXON_ID=66468 /ORGANISM="Heterocapsa triquestra, Strain CCMP 448" /LENGTH=97 /DNA_ID=CAMNT_0040175883 /DNA_START=24 /DNA_END=314 /DNA_ORIENTATION=-
MRKKSKPWYIALVDDYISFWNCVDWLSIFIACVILGLFMMLMLRLGSVNTSLAEIATRLDEPEQLDESYVEMIREFYELVENMNGSERNFRFALCIY